MSYHYGSSSSSSSSSSRVAATPAVAPPGYHYMPDGSLMLDSEMEDMSSANQRNTSGRVQTLNPTAYGGKEPCVQQMSCAPGHTWSQRHCNCMTYDELSGPYDFGGPTGGLIAPPLNEQGTTEVLYNTGENIAFINEGVSAEDTNGEDTSAKVINSIDLDLSDIEWSGETRNFTVRGTNKSTFYIQIINGSGNYYDFNSRLFQATQTRFNGQIVGGISKGSIVFPVVTGDAEYNIYIYALPGTTHTNHNEVRFDDDSIDINSSTGSNSLSIQKVIYQYQELTLTLSGHSPNSTVAGTFGTDTVTVDRGQSKDKTAFSFTTTAGATAAYRVLKQPTVNDLVSFVEPVIGAAPITLPGENIYPTARAAFTGDDVNGAVTSGSVVRMDNTDLSAVIEVGDKITSPATTDTVNGDFSSRATAITMDTAVATKMAVGDRVTGNAELNGTIFTVASIDSTNVFSLNSAAAIDDGITLTFSSKVNRELTTVTVVETSGTATDFTMSQAIQFRDNQPLTFTPQMNYSWPIDNFVNIIKEDMVVGPSTNIVAGTLVSDYEDSITIDEGTKQEKKIIKNYKEAVNTLGLKPTIVKGLVTVQAGQVVFDKQQPLALAGDTIRIGGYGQGEILKTHGWEASFTDLAIALTAPTTTTTEAISGHATIAVADREGIINTVSTVSGIGIDPSAADPTLTTGGGLDGAGDWIMSAVQTLENGVTLTVGNTGRIATITGNIEIVKAGTAAKTLRLDIEKLLSTSAP